MNTLLAVVGMPGAGKSLVTNYLVEKLGAPKVRFGDVTDQELKRRRLEYNLENDRNVREGLRKQFGMEAFAIKSLPQIEKALHHHPVVIIDGLYSWEEFLFLKSKFESVVLVAVFAPSRVRHQRVVGRRLRTLKSIDEVRSRDIAEISNLNKGGPIAFADYLVVNSSSKQKAFKQIDFILRDLKLQS